MPGFRLHQSKGGKKGLWAIDVNKNWRIVFKFENGNALHRQLCGLSLMSMHNPPHPGEFIREVYLEPFKFGYRSVALKLKVSPSTFLRLINKQSNISPEMALRLSKGLGRSPESWLAMQDNYNLWHAKKVVNLDEIEPIAMHA